MGPAVSCCRKNFSNLGTLYIHQEAVVEDDAVRSLQDFADYVAACVVAELDSDRTEQIFRGLKREDKKDFDTSLIRVKEMSKDLEKKLKAMGYKSYGFLKQVCTDTDKKLDVPIDNWSVVAYTLRTWKSTDQSPSLSDFTDHVAALVEAGSDTAQELTKKLVSEHVIYEDEADQLAARSSELRSKAKNGNSLQDLIEGPLAKEIEEIEDMEDLFEDPQSLAVYEDIYKRAAEQVLSQNPTEPALDPSDSGHQIQSCTWNDKQVIARKVLQQLSYFAVQKAKRMSEGVVAKLNAMGFYSYEYLRDSVGTESQWKEVCTRAEIPVAFEKAALVKVLRPHVHQFEHADALVSFQYLGTVCALVLGLVVSHALTSANDLRSADTFFLTCFNERFRDYIDPSGDMRIQLKIPLDMHDHSNPFDGIPDVLPYAVALRRLANISCKPDGCLAASEFLDATYFNSLNILMMDSEYPYTPSQVLLWSSLTCIILVSLPLAYSATGIMSLMFIRTRQNLKGMWLWVKISSGLITMAYLSLTAASFVYFVTLGVSLIIRYQHLAMFYYVLRVMNPWYLAGLCVVLGFSIFWGIICACLTLVYKRQGLPELQQCR